MMNALTLASGAASGKSKAKVDQKVKKDRVQLDFAPRAMERLNALKAKTEASSYAEVVKNALRIYEALIEETESGKKFLVQDKNGALHTSAAPLASRAERRRNFSRTVTWATWSWKPISSVRGGSAIAMVRTPVRPSSVLTATWA